MAVLPPDPGAELSRGAAARNARGPTVLQVLPALGTGGVERGTIEIAAAVAAAGGRALVASAGGRLESRLRGVGGEHLAGPYASKNPLTALRNAARLAAVIRAQGVDVVHARSRAPAWSAWLACRRTRTPFVTTWHGVYSDGAAVKRFYNGVMARGRPTIAISNFVAGIVREAGLDERWIRVIPRGADLALFDPDAATPGRTTALLERWRLLEDTRPVVLAPGRLSGWKGFEVVIDAAARLRARRGADFLCLVVGDGAAETVRALEARARRAGAADVVRMVGACDDMPAAYKLADIVVSAATRPEAFGRVAVEAQAMARPVIATNHGGARETVEHGRTGWLCAPGDAAAMADALDAALSLPPPARAAMGAAGRAHVAERFSLEAMQRATLAVYAEAAGRGFPA